MRKSNLKVGVSIICIVFIVGLVNSYGQKVEITLKNKQLISAEIKVFSYDQLYFVDGEKLSYNEISVINFITFSSTLNGLMDKLVEAKVMFTGNVPDNYKNYFEIPHKGDNKIIIVCSDSLANLYKRIGTHLAMKSYGIEYSDDTFLTFKTGYKVVDDWSIVYFLNVFVMANTVRITAKWKLNSQSDDEQDWDYTNNKRGNVIAGPETIKGMIYNDIMDAISDFDKVKIQYQ